MPAKIRTLIVMTAAAALGLALAFAPPSQAADQPSGASAAGQGGQPTTNPWAGAQNPKAAAQNPKAAGAGAQKHRAKRQVARTQAAEGAGTTMPGQDAFGAIAEVVRTLEADPNTDWSKVDLEALRRHLIDMNEVTLNAVAAAKPIDGGLKITVTGTGRTVGAIQRMVTAHAKEIDGLNDWSVKTQSLANGTLLQVTSSDENEVKHIRGLGFIGIMVTGSHHPMHHLAMAKGDSPHKH
jgi:hypothetical protein